MINKMKSILGITTALLTSTVHYVLSQNNMMERDSIIKETDSINMNIKQVNNDKLVIRLGARNFIWARGFWSFMTRLDILYPYNKNLSIGMYGYWTLPNAPWVLEYFYGKDRWYGFNAIYKTDITLMPRFEKQTVRYTHIAVGLVGEYKLLEGWKLIKRHYKDEDEKEYKSNDLFIGGNIGYVNGYVTDKLILRSSGRTFLGGWVDYFYNDVIHHQSLEITVFCRVRRNNNKKIRCGLSFFVTYIPIIYKQGAYVTGWIYEINGLFGVKNSIKNAIKNDKL